MKRVVKAALILMAILTVIYVSAVVYADVNSPPYPHRYVLYAAFEYEGDTPPTEWYTPEQLGIYDAIEYEENGSWLHIAVFLYKDKFYQVSPLWVTPGLPESIKQSQFPIGGVLGAGWVFTAILFKWRKKE